MGTGQAVGRTDKRPRGHPVAGDGGGHSHESVSERGRNSSTAPAPQDDGGGDSIDTEDREGKPAS